jgi:hypothetical protein
MSTLSEMTEKEVLESDINIPYNIIGYRLISLYHFFGKGEWFTPEEAAEKLKVPLAQIKPMLRGFYHILVLMGQDDDWKYKLEYSLHHPPFGIVGNTDK